MKSIFITLALLAFGASPALACNFGTCRHCRAQVVEQVFVPQSINYFVGAPIRVEAIVQKELRANPLYQEFLQFQQWRKGREGEAPPSHSPLSILAEKCGRCHGGATPKAQLVLDGSAPLAASAITQALRMISTGQMPPETAGALSAAEKGAVMQQLLELERKEIER